MSTLSGIALDGVEYARQLHAQIDLETNAQKELGVRIDNGPKRFKKPTEYISSHSSVDFPEDVESAGFDAMVQYALQLRNQETKEQVAKTCDAESDMVLA